MTEYIMAAAALLLGAGVIFSFSESELLENPINPCLQPVQITHKATKLDYASLTLPTTIPVVKKQKPS